MLSNYYDYDDKIVFLKESQMGHSLAIASSRTLLILSTMQCYQK